MKTKSAIKWIAILAMIIAGYAGYVSWDIYEYGKVNEMVKADAAIILGAGVVKNKPSPVFAERIKHAVWLYKNDYVKKLIFTGGKGEGNMYSDSFIAREYALSRGVPDKDILIEDLSRTTRENIIYAAQVAESGGLSTFIIVSDPLHMRRAMLIAEDNRLKAIPSPTPSSKYKTPKAKVCFLMREVCIYIGYSFYRLLPV